MLMDWIKTDSPIAYQRMYDVNIDKQIFWDYIYKSNNQISYFNSKIASILNFEFVFACYTIPWGAAWKVFQMLIVMLY